MGDKSLTCHPDNIYAAFDSRDRFVYTDAKLRNGEKTRKTINKKVVKKMKTM